MQPVTRRRTYLGVALVLGIGLLLAAGCGEEPGPRPLEAYLEEGAAAFQRGDALAREADATSAVDEAEATYAEAVAAWMEAADAWRQGFRLLDPVPEEDDRRAMLAFRIARAFAKAARHTRTLDWAGLRADHAFLWLDQTARLAPSMRQVHYERARLFDSDVPRAMDLMAAHAAYRRYLAAVDDAEAPISEAEGPRVALARERAAALAPPEPEAPK